MSTENYAAARLPRQDWDEQFRAMAHLEDDRLLDAEHLPLTKWQADDWQWEPDEGEPKQEQESPRPQDA